MADKLIPGLPLSIRIAILQQTIEDDKRLALNGHKTVLETVVEGDVYRNRLVDEAESKSHYVSIKV
jgi:hypothetical protein